MTLAGASERGWESNENRAVTNDDRVDWASAYGLFPGDVCYVSHAGTHASEVARGLEASGFQIRAQIMGQTTLRLEPG